MIFKAIQNLIKRARVSDPQDDSGQIPIVQISYLGKTGNAEVIHPYGMGSLPPVNSVGVVLSIQGQEDNRAFIATLPDKRIKNLKPGEVFVGNTVSNATITFKENGDIDVSSSGTVNVNSGTINLNGSCALGGGGPAIARVGDAVLVAGTPGTITSGSGSHTAS